MRKGEGDYSRARQIEENGRFLEIAAQKLLLF
jgi:hypothetical protein